ncbi:hypothetical protein [Reyranella sp.]|uniref:hypothetical protein n=1 Tax=Reyranella sp. TaxID=1929291 RepID=UPI003D11D8B8
MSVDAASWPAKAYRLWLHEMKLLLPPTIYFFCAFNLIVFTTNLLTRSYFLALTNFLTATALALLVGKAVLVADKFRAIHRFQHAPLIKPILYKTLFYGLVVMLFRIIEQLVHFSFDADGFRVALNEAVEAFTWHRFAAIQIWLFTCFLIYVTAAELSKALGPGKLRQLLFGPR